MQAERIRETIHIQVGDSIATTRTRDRHTVYEARQAGLFQAVEVQTVRLFDAAGRFLGGRDERVERGLYRVVRADETADVVIADHPFGSLALVSVKNA